MVPWPEVFSGSSVYYVTHYIHEATAGRIMEILKVIGVERWGDKVECVGVAGMSLAVVVALVIPEPKKQKSLVPRVTNDFALHRGKKATKARGVKLAWRDLNAICLQMVKLKSLWILILSMGVKRLAASLMKTYLPGYFRNAYPGMEELERKYGLIYGATGSISILVGGITALIIWRTTTTWRWKSVPFWMTAIGGITSSIFLISVIFFGDDHDKHTVVKVLYSNLTLALFTSETWLGVSSTFVISLLDLAYKTFGFSICGVVQLIIYAAGPEVLRLSLDNKHLPSDSYRRILQITLSVSVIICYFGAGIGFVIATRLVRIDMDVPDIASGFRSRIRQLGFGIAFIALMTGSIVLLAFNIRSYL